MKLFRHFSSRRFLFSGAFLVALLGIGIFALTQEVSLSSGTDISSDSSAIFSDDNALHAYVKKYGPKQTVQRLDELSAKFGTCHDAAHKAGRFSYELFGEKAFRECGAECHSGCYHGATEAFFKEHGTANLQSDLKTLCNSELNPFFSHQCIHGIGHGLMAWTNYEIYDALKSCDLLDQRRDSCYTGVFMENIVGGLAKDEGHFTKYLNDDPQYPCTVVDEQYKGSCYFLQTSRMVQLYGGNFQKVAASCAEAPAAHQFACFSSMGRDVGGRNAGNPQSAIAACAFAPAGQSQIACLEGAVQDTFWDPGGQDKAIAFCALLQEKSQKDSCVTMIIGRSHDVLSLRTDQEAFCRKLEGDYRAQCLSLLQ